MRKTVTVILLLAAVFLPLFSCSGLFFDPNLEHMRDGGFGPNPKDGGNPGNGENPGGGGNPNEGGQD